MRQFFTNRWIIRVLSMVLPGALTALAEYMITGGVGGWAPLVAVVIGGFASVLVLWLVDKRKVEEPPAQQSLPAHYTEGKDFSPRTPAELIASVKGLTDIAAASATQHDIGLWLRVDGTARNVKEHISSDVIEVSVVESGTKVSLFLDFAASRWGARLRSLDVGDSVSAIGRITHIARSGHVVLEDCELLN